MRRLRRRRRLRPKKRHKKRTRNVVKRRNANMPKRRDAKSVRLQEMLVRIFTNSGSTSQRRKLSLLRT